MTTTIPDILKEAAKTLDAAGVSTPRLDAEVLLAHVLGCTRLELPLRRDRVLHDDHVTQFRAFIKEREARKPVSHILGVREFWSLDFKVSNAVLTPRPDSETLVAAVLERLGDKAAPYRILDIGVGSGCLFGAVLSECPNATGVGVDISQAAVKLADENLQSLGLAGRFTVYEGDLFQPVKGDVFDVILSNPPYIESAEIPVLDPEISRFEPLAALDGGGDGLGYYRRIAAVAASYISHDGFIALEIGANQGQAVAGLFQNGWSQVDLLPDLEKRDRVIIVKK